MGTSRGLLLQSSELVASALPPPGRLKYTSTSPPLPSPFDVLLAKAELLLLVEAVAVPGPVVAVVVLGVCCVCVLV